MVSDILPVGICAFTKFKSSMLKKGIISPIKIERPLALKVYSVLCSEFIISPFSLFVNMFYNFYIITFREVEKSLPCVKGGGTRKRDGGIVKV